MDAELLDMLRRRTVEGAVGTSALRNQGAPGVINAAKNSSENLTFLLFW